ncbi:MAG: glycosyltransferase [Roseburia sp.]|nr:glycosyltransferase [Roseburia sp.]
MRINKYMIKKGIACLKEYGFRELYIRAVEKLRSQKISYDKWYKKHAMTAEQEKAQREDVKNWQNTPMVSICVPLYKTPEAYLCEMIDSVVKQTYPNWQLCLADGSPDEKLHELIKERYGVENRIRYRHLEENLGIAENTNKAFEMAEGEWISLLDHDDILPPEALYETLVAANIAEGKASLVKRKKIEGIIEAVYSDEDKISEDLTEHFDPHFKPDFNIDLLRTNNYITHLFTVRREIVEKVGGFISKYNGAQDFDFIFRCTDAAKGVAHVPRILYHWRTSAGSTAENPASKMYAYEAGKLAIEDHLKAKGIEGEVSMTRNLGFYRVKYKVQQEELISIIIPNKDQVAMLKKCIASVERSTYGKYEVILVENNSTEKETFAYYEELAGCGYTADVPMEGKLANGNRICVVTWKDYFNYSAINNFGAGFTKGKYLLLLNNDIEIQTADWLEEMLGHCQREDVAAVGCKLLYPDGTIQHAGVGVGLGGIANSMFVGMDSKFHGYMHRANLQLNYSAVTAACMMVKKSVFEEVGGLEEELTVAYNDIDLCLKMGAAGYRIVYTPYAVATHYESKSRGYENTPEKQARLQKESDYMLKKWADIFEYGDPYYNPNFSKKKMDYTIDRV